MLQAPSNNPRPLSKVLPGAWANINFKTTPAEAGEVYKTYKTYCVSYLEKYESALEKIKFLLEMKAKPLPLNPQTFPIITYKYWTF